VEDCLAARLAALRHNVAMQAESSSNAEASTVPLDPSRRGIAVRARDLLPAIRFALSQLKQSQAPAMAANLAFRTLFGLLPVLVVATIVTRAILGDRFQEQIGHAIEALGMDQVAIRPSEGSGGGEVPLSAWLQSLASEAANIDLSAIGLVGALAVVFSAVWTMVAIESSFNTILRAPNGRPFVRRVLIYWFVITAGPVLFAAIPLGFKAMTEYVGTESMVGSAVTWLVSLLGAFVSLWALLTAAYVAVPNAKVDLRAAMLGAFVATILVELGKRFLGASLAGSFSASRLYGSLGLVPLFMMWVYLMWLVVLFGLQTTAILQGFSRGGRALAAPPNAVDLFEPAQAIGAFRVICSRFREGRGAAADTLVRECSIPLATARELLIVFERRGLAHRIDGDERRYSPSRPPEEILQRDALRAGFALSDGGEEAGVRDEITMLREVQVAKLGNAHFGKA
jgi:membrane protein